MESIKGADEFAGAYGEWLPDSHRRALHDAAIYLTREMLDIVCSLEADVDDDEVEEGQAFEVDYLPRIHATRYDSRFAERFLACMMAVTWKLGQPEREYSLSCVGEELALNAIIERAETVLESEGVEADFDGLRTMAFEDEDCHLMFDPSWDGVEHTPELGMAHMPFDQWFDKFDSATERVHPYALAR
jgi:hypothetical protein